MITLPARGCCKVYNEFLFYAVCLFAQIHSAVSASMEIVEVKKFVMFGALWKVEVGTNREVKKVY